MEITLFYKVNADNTVTARTPTGVRTYSDWASLIQRLRRGGGDSDLCLLVAGIRSTAANSA